MSVTSTAPYDGREIANLLLDKAVSRHVELTQISLLKILYFCQGWYLLYRNKPLISNDFEAWENGPVIKVVRDAFKSFGANPITGRASKFDLMSGEVTPIIPHLNPDDDDFVGQIFEVYHVFGPWELRDMTHETGSPWHKLWKSDRPVARFGLRIKNQEILEHFRLKATQKSAIVIKS
jgi:uncharacterized phage-associated protein